MIEVSLHYPISRRVNEPDSDKIRIEFIAPKKPFLWWGTCHEAVEIQYPKGYGIAYYSFLTHRILFAPIPFNIIVSWIIWLWQFLRIGFSSKASRQNLEYKIEVITRNRIRKEMAYKIDRAKEQAKREGINKAMEWWNYVLSNRSISDEELLEKRIEILGF